MDYAEKMYLNGDIEVMSNSDVLQELYSRYSRDYEADSGYSLYEWSRLSLKAEQTDILRQFAKLNRDLDKLLRLIELEQRCVGIDMITPLKPTLSSGKVVHLKLV